MRAKYGKNLIQLSNHCNRLIYQKKEKSSTTLLEDAARLTSLRNNITRSCL